MKHFQQELSALKQRVVEMGHLAASMVAGSTDALIKADRSRLQRVLTDEPTLDRFQIEIDGEAIRLMTIYARSPKISGSC